MVSLDDLRGDTAVLALDQWLESMRGPSGYTGPISHWWDSSLIYTGAMLDWRYEGILCGYLNLYHATSNAIWLRRAQQAGDDLIAGQQTDGHFWNSSFEFGPAIGGTPHEAAATIGLLELASVLRAEKLAEWQRYFAAAEQTIRQVLIGRLWTGRGFREQPDDDCLVANKNATTLEALLLYEALSGESMQLYITAAAQVVLSCQVAEGSRAGATVHAGTHQHALTFGIYTARCVSAIARLIGRQPLPMYAAFIQKAVRYLSTLVQADGTLLGHYKSGPLIGAPRWISPSGDLLRAFLLAQPYATFDQTLIAKLVSILVNAQYPGGGIPTANGFARLGRLKFRETLPEFRDVLPVVGWCDKAFRALTMLYQPHYINVTTSFQKTEIDCVWRNRRCWFREDKTRFMLTEQRSGHLYYEWHKGESYPDVIDL
ncbi:MAG: hypothetical protein ABI947_19035 [Chloroflexota bacterium]